jgi:hypothetical protein
MAERRLTALSCARNEKLRRKRTELRIRFPEFCVTCAGPCMQSFVGVRFRAHRDQRSLASSSYVSRPDAKSAASGVAATSTARVSLDDMTPEAFARVAPELAARIVADSRDRVGWMRARSRGITATDVAQLTSHTAIARAADAKLGAGRGFSGNAYTDHGRRREPEIAAWVAATHGIQPSSALFHAVVEKRHLATPDGIAVDADGRVTLAEIKTTNKTWRSIPAPTCDRSGGSSTCSAPSAPSSCGRSTTDSSRRRRARCAWVERDEREIGSLVRLATELIDELYRRTTRRRTSVEPRWMPSHPARASRTALWL